MPIGENIKRLRIMHGLSQKELAQIAGVSDKAVSTWENGTKEPRMGAVQKIADHFGLKKSNLIEDNGLEINITPVQSPAPAASDLPTLTQRDSTAHSKRDLNDLAKFLNKSEVMFDGDTYNLSEEDQQKLRNALEFVFWDAKRQNKRKKD